MSFNRRLVAHSRESRRPGEKAEIQAEQLLSYRLKVCRNWSHFWLFQARFYLPPSLCYLMPAAVRSDSAFLIV